MQIKQFIDSIFSVKNETVNNKKFKVLRLCGLKFKKKIAEYKTMEPPVPYKSYYLFPNMDWYEHSFKDYVDCPELKDSYLKLIKDLDKDSIETVSKIIYRYKHIKQNGTPNFILSQREINEILNNEIFKQEIIQLENNLFAYQNYLLPHNRFEYAIFAKDYYINEFSNHDRNKNILDVGAFIGDSAIVFSRYTNKKVYAFEPLSNNYEKLKTTIKINNYENIVPINSALGNEKNTSAEIFVNSGLSASLFQNSSGTKSNISINTLDEWIKENPIEIGLIKVDIESAEQKFLQGAINTIKSQKPNMIIAIYHGAYDFFEIKPLIESWNLGYKFKIIKTAPEEISNETLLFCTTENFINNKGDL